MAGGRPSIYSQELVDTFCKRIALGSSLRTVCLAEDMPDASTIFEWIRKYEEFAKQYARATEERAEAQSEEILDISDDALDDALKGSDNKAVNAIVQAHRMRIDTRKWLMSKMKPKKYGDKLDLTSGGEKLPTPLLHVLPKPDEPKE